MHGLNWCDFGNRYLRNDGPGWMSIDPLCEKYYSISPYVYCNNNPVRYFDPTGEDYWSTSDPAEIERFFRALTIGIGGNIGYDYSSWNHATDAEFTENLTFNDETQTFYSSYGTVINNEVVITGISAKAISFDNGRAIVFGWKPASGKIEQDNFIFDLFLGGGTKVGRSLITGLFSRTNSYSTVNTFDANAKVHSRGMPHGDSGREMKKVQARIKELKEEMKTATVKEKKKLQKKIQRLLEDASNKERGETHWR